MGETPIIGRINQLTGQNVPPGGRLLPHNFGKKQKPCPNCGHPEAPHLRAVHEDMGTWNGCAACLSSIIQQAALFYVPDLLKRIVALEEKISLLDGDNR